MLLARELGMEIFQSFSNLRGFLFCFVFISVLTIVIFHAILLTKALTYRLCYIFKTAKARMLKIIACDSLTIHTSSFAHLEAGITRSIKTLVHEWRHDALPRALSNEENGSRREALARLFVASRIIIFQDPRRRSSPFTRRVIND